MSKELIEKVRKEYLQNKANTIRRFQFLKTMKKEHKPIDHDDVIKSWEEGIRLAELK